MSKWESTATFASDATVSCMRLTSESATGREGPVTEDEDSPVICAIAEEGAIPNRVPGFDRAPGFDREPAIAQLIKSDIEFFQLVAKAMRGSMVGGISAGN